MKGETEDSIQLKILLLLQVIARQMEDRGSDRHIDKDMRMSRMNCCQIMVTDSATETMMSTTCSTSLPACLPGCPTAPPPEMKV